MIAFVHFHLFGVPILAAKGKKPIDLDSAMTFVLQCNIFFNDRIS